MVKKPCKNQIGPKGRSEMYIHWIKLPTLAKAIFPKLYDLKSLVLNALKSMGRLLETKIILAIAPAMIGKF